MAEVGERAPRAPRRRRPQNRRKPPQTRRIDPAEVERRASLVPAIVFPDDLPVSQRRDDIAAAIRDHQVVVVAGETGSGKTTQLPKICLELGRGIHGMIGHTQPRRIAARSVAERIAEELGQSVGEPGSVVGYQVRFTDHSSRDTLVKLMTDGILLAELQHDRMLSAYDTIIIDEAHERSLNIDFILGYLRQLLPRRPDLKVIITSATIDPERFAAHFAARRPDARADRRGVRAHLPGRAPLPAAGRGVVRRRRGRAGRPRPDRGDRGRRTRAASPRAPATSWCSCPASGRSATPPTCSARCRRARPAVKGFDVVPLYARLSSAEQHKVFERHTRRRVVLATNVAETSLTVPGIRYVVDAGFARISRYSYRTKVQRLPIEPISQASANQRSGRCGRVEAGIAIRLYSEEDYESRPEFTDPEILRTNLASVILQMTALGLGDVARFPFVDPPDQRNVKAGVQLLEELGAVTTDGQGLRDEAPRPTSPAPSSQDGQAHPRPSEPRRSAPGRAASASPLWAASSSRCRSTRGWPGWCWRPTGSAACARCWSSPRRCRCRTPASGRSSSGAGRPEARPVQGRDQRLPDAAQPVALRAPASSASCPPARSGGCARRSTSTTCGSASGRSWSRSCARSASS